MNILLRFILCVIGWIFLWQIPHCKTPFGENVCTFVGGMLLIIYGMTGD